MRDPYSVLDITKSANEKDIKSAFRKLAKKYHPDQNKDDPKAQAKFAEINQAYEIIGDTEKRAKFDRGEIDAKGNEKFSGFHGGGPFGGSRFRREASHSGGPFGPGGFGGGEEILSEVFGSAFGGQRGRQSAPRPSLDIKTKAFVSLEELMRGKTSVKLPDGKQVSVSIPPEPEEGQTIRLKGQGKKAPGNNPGDVLITIHTKPDANFQRSGANLKMDLPVPLKTAVLGGKLAVETLDGKFSLNIPAGTSSGKVFRLKGKGLPKKTEAKQPEGSGDLLISASIQLPEDGLEALAQFFNEDK